MEIDFPHPLVLARKASKQSNYKIQMGAALVVGKSIIKGFNKIKTHPDFGYSVHAEMDCLTKSKKYDIIGSTIYIYRENNKGPALARPCESCLRVLKRNGVNKIYYSIDTFPFYKSEILN